MPAAPAPRSPGDPEPEVKAWSPGQGSKTQARAKRRRIRPSAPAKQQPAEDKQGSKGADALLAKLRERRGKKE